MKEVALNRIQIISLAKNVNFQTIRRTGRMVFAQQQEYF